MLEAIYTRVGIITKVPAAAVMEENVESLNVLNYPEGAEYTPHYDWGADGKVRLPMCRTPNQSCANCALLWNSNNVRRCCRTMTGLVAVHLIAAVPQHPRGWRFHVIPKGYYA